MSKNYITNKKINDKRIIEINNFPKLYKYQSINNYSTSSFINNELWGTVPTQFNDPYDMTTVYNEKAIEQHIKEKITSQNFDVLKEMFSAKDKQDLVKIIKSIYTNYSDNLNKQLYCVSCFSTEYNNDLMWAHYSSCGRGFVLEYDGNELYTTSKKFNEKILNEFSNFEALKKYVDDELKKERCTLCPVIYENRKADLTDMIITVVDEVINFAIELKMGNVNVNEINNLILKVLEFNMSNERNPFFEILCLKNKEWKYEKEWRLWTYNLNAIIGRTDINYMKISSNIIPKAIYLGENISLYDEIALKQIAKDKNMTIYKMKSFIKDNRRVLKAVELLN